MSGPAVAGVIGGLLAVTWLLLRRRELPPAATAPPFAGVSLVVPARNEEATLPVLLTSVRALDPPAHEVLVVDDGSTDRTADVAAAAGATVVTAPPLPPGWLGKPWACHVGAARAGGTHLLFLDADTRLAPDALGRLLAGHRGGLLSVQPFHVTERPHEQLSAFPNLVAVAGTGAWAPALPARRPAAYGPCLFVTPDDLRRTGGHAAVRGEVVEDVALARRFAAAGLPVACRAGGDTVQFRMYPEGLGQLGEGWTKNLATGAAGASPVAVVLAVWWVAACAAVATAAIAGLASWVAGGDPPVVAGVLWLITAVHLHLLLRRIGRFRWWTSAAFPVPLAAFLVLFARSTVRRLAGRPSPWRGRQVGAATR